MYIKKCNKMDFDMDYINTNIKKCIINKVDLSGLNLKYLPNFFI